MLSLLHNLLRLAPGTALPIGVDFDQDCVRLLQLEAESGRRPRVRAVARRDLQGHRRPQGPGPSEAAMEAVADLLRRRNFHGRRIVAALPRALTQFKTLRLNTGGGDDLPRQLAREARNGLGIDVTTGEHLVHFLPGDSLRRGSDTHQEGILVAIRKSDVEDFLVRLHNTGAEVAAIDLEPLSLFRSVQRYHRRRRDSQDVTVLVELGSRATQVLIGRAGKVSFLKSISIGTQTMYATVARKLDLALEEASNLCQRLSRQVNEAWRNDELAAIEQDPLHRAVYSASRASVEDLAREVSLCLRYYCVTFKCKRPERVLLCGNAAEDPRLSQTLAASLPIPVESRRALLDLEIPAALEPVMQQNSEEWTRTVGLALRFAPGGLAGRAGLTRQLQALADELPEDLDSPRELPGMLEPMLDGILQAPGAEVAHV